MARAHPLLAALLALGLLGAGCGDPRAALPRLHTLPPVSTAGALVFAVPQTGRAIVVRPELPAPVAVELAALPRAAHAVPGSNRVLVLAGEDRAPQVQLLDVDTLEVATLPSPGPFDAVAFSADGRFAVLTYLSQTSTTRLARNLNEVGVLDLSTRTLTRVQLDTDSLAPRAVTFGPAGADRQLVAVSFERGVAIFDARRPEQAPRRISIRPRGSTVDQSVLEALFSPDGRFLFLRAQGLDDVVTVELQELSGELAASLNFLAGGRGLSDIELPPDGQPGVLALFAASRELRLLDPRGIAQPSAQVTLPDALTQLRVLSPRQVLASSPSSRALLALDVVDGRSGEAALDAPASFATISLPTATALFGHASVPSANGQAALSIVRAEDDGARLKLRVRSILLSSPVAGATFDPSGTRLFFAGTAGRSIAALELGTLALAEVPLDASSGALLHLGTSETLAAIHPEALGDVTFLPASPLSREGAVRFQLLALTGELDRFDTEAP